MQDVPQITFVHKTHHFNLLALLFPDLSLESDPGSNRCRIDGCALQEAIHLCPVVRRKVYVLTLLLHPRSSRLDFLHENLDVRVGLGRPTATFEVSLQRSDDGDSHLWERDVFAHKRVEFAQDKHELLCE